MAYKHSHQGIIKTTGRQ